MVYLQSVYRDFGCQSVEVWIESVSSGSVFSFEVQAVEDLPH